MTIKPLKSTPHIEGNPGEVPQAAVLYPVSKSIRLFKLKRMLDLVMAGFGLLLLVPLFFVIYIIIKWEDPRAPVFFSQTRVGKDARTFKMYKFRTMVVNAEQMKGNLLHLNEISGAMFKMKNDPRITNIGRILRKTSLDELPQLWNVLRGDMSIVGPRPPLPEEVAEYTAYDVQRLAVMPGCTGLWQVSGRNDVGFRDMVELDLQYIREQSLFMDLYIIVKTFKVMFGAKDAF
ncbi:sugar transferase [Paenibacillus faecalis]|uniref:sugar transferase n=1 Tax=Paenibacillus faecalis TaxID=2079532 RepID=UPI000D0F73E1|nr:sugar transferase [Paenibacillus faecalis]